MTAAAYTPPETAATVQPHPGIAPSLASQSNILARFAEAVRGCGVVGERATAQLVYLVVTSRLLDKPVSLGVKGHSASGKSFVVETTCKFFPRSAEWPPDVVAAAGRLLASARALARETDPELAPQSAIAARSLLRTCALLWRDVRP